MWGSSKYDRELNVVTCIFQTALTQHGGHDKREHGNNEFCPCDVNITADQVTNYMKGNEIHVQMSRFNYFTKSPRFWDFRFHGACVPWFKTWCLEIKSM